METKGKHQTTRIVIYSGRHSEVPVFLIKSNHSDGEHVEISFQRRLTYVGRR